MKGENELESQVKEERSQQIEKVTISLPVNMMNFFRALHEFSNFDIQEYLEDCVASSLEADIYNQEFCSIITAEDLDKKFGLKKWLQGDLRNIHWYELPETQGE